MNHSIAALLGNGVSIAYNQDLRLDRIMREITRRINEDASASGSEPIRFLQRAAQRIDSGDPTTDFEALFGPFGQYRDGIEIVRDLARLSGDDPKLQDSMKLTIDYIESIRRAGVGHVLEVIANQSRATTSPSEVSELTNNLVEAAGGRQLTIGNLNYDSLIMAALANDHPADFCDMADGRVSEQTVDVGPHVLVGRPLRRTASFPYSRSITLLHLHGSLCWLRDPRTNTVWRVDAAGMRSAGFWRAYRDGRSLWTPEVVLTNQATKSAEVSRYPFSLAYEVFYRRLVAADRWFIGGYSFRDGCVNDLLAKAWRKRATTPMIYVVTLGKQPTRRRILDGIGHVGWADPDPEDFLLINRHGIEAAQQASDWAWWSALPDMSKAG